MDGDEAGEALFRLEQEPLSGRADQFFHGREFGDDLSARAAVSVELAWGEQVDDRADRGKNNGGSLRGRPGIFDELRMLCTFRGRA